MRLSPNNCSIAFPNQTGGYQRFSAKFVPNLAILIALLLMVLAALLPVSTVSAASLNQEVTVDIPALRDTGIIEGLPDYVHLHGADIFVFHRRNENSEVLDIAFIEFDLAAIPNEAVISEAKLELHLDFSPTAPPQTIEIGLVTDEWNPYPFSWNTQPAVTWSTGNPAASPTASATGPLAWPMTSLVRSWLDGTIENHGIALRPLVLAGGVVTGQTSDAADDPTTDADGFSPRLVVTYTLPTDTEPRPDLGDAPDSSNHHSFVNRAYPNVPGNFPTVWQVPSGEVAGPRHLNQTYEAILGQYLSREADADQGLDQDGANNILQNAAGLVGDIADLDRGDDGWRNRNIRFIDCLQQTLTVRVYRDANSTQEIMYLNTWFDGNRDGDWADRRACVPLGSSPNRPLSPSYEWIVQNEVIDMATIPADGYRDIQIPTERIYNGADDQSHWMRFTLSEEPAIVPSTGGLPDGRGLHPVDDSAPSGFLFGETEDVLYNPPPLGEVGELLLEKQVINAISPVPYGETVTYQVRLSHTGGSQPIQAQIRDELTDVALHLSPRLNADGQSVYVNVTSPTGGVSPLVAQVRNSDDASSNEVVFWEGILKPNAEVILTFDVTVHPFCHFFTGTRSVENVAQARSPEGTQIQADIAFDGQCFVFDTNDLPIGEVELDSSLGEAPVGFRWESDVHNRHDHEIILGLVQQLSGTPNDEDATDDGPGDEPRHMVTKASTGDSARFLGSVTFDPDEKKRVALQLEMDSAADKELSFLNDDAPLGRLRYCLLPYEDATCPSEDEYPNLWGEWELPHVPRRADLGDAPDSTNHFTPTMEAYLGIQANFPTVFDPATGLPPGPRHLRPWLFHLGPDVSNEVEADIGRDADGVNNIEPLADTPDQDWYDDGSSLTLQGACEPAIADVEVNVSLKALQHFSTTNPTAYLNVWLDWSYDGDWDDSFVCIGPGGQGEGVAEHILIDYPIDVAAMMAGTNTITGIVTSRVPWPAQFNEMERWIRFTLSDQPSNKTLSYFDPKDDKTVEYGDGRGHDKPFKSGETEDYLWDLRDDAPTWPDMVIQAHGEIHIDRPSGNPPGTPTKELVFKVNYANIGSQATTDAVLTLTKTDPIRNIEIQAVAGPGIDSGSVTNDANSITIPLPPVAPNQTGTVLLRLGPLSEDAVSTAAMLLDELEIVATIMATGDLNVNNNAISILIERPNAPLRLAGTVDGDALWRKRDTTCRTSLNLTSRGEPMEDAVLMLNGAVSTRGQYDANGILSNGVVSGLKDGNNLIWVDYVGDPTLPGNVSPSQSIRLQVDSSLVVDPITLLLTDDQGRQVHPSTFSWKSGSLATYLLHSGESYTVSIQSCSAEVEPRISLLLGGERLTTLQDEEGDGRYIGRFTYQPTESDPDVFSNGDNRVQSAGTANDNQLSLLIQANGVEQSIIGQMESVNSGTVVDAVSGQPIAGAEVTPLLNGTVANLPTVNSLTTDADGTYGFDVPDDTYQLLFTSDGYQPYRSRSIVVSNGRLAEDIRLVPAVDEAADHTIYITAQGFSPALIDANPGDVVEWLNSDLSGHITKGRLWDSGQLMPTEGFKIRLTEEGSYPYSNDEDSSFGEGVISVQSGSSNDEPSPTDPSGGDTDDLEMQKLFLPLVQQ
ncbi:MAG: DNRLRE domain-containing protein [Chloroflexota bacterium]